MGNLRLISHLTKLNMVRITGGQSLFDRGFKKFFDLNKYRKPTDPIVTSTTSHKKWGNSFHEFAFGRFVLMCGLAAGLLYNYHEPGVYHELFGHAQYGTRSTIYHSYVTKEEHAVNAQLIEREKVEQEVDKFMDDLTVNTDNL